MADLIRVDRDRGDWVEQQFREIWQNERRAALDRVTEDDARSWLCSTISEISETALCAGWVGGIEFDVWRLLQDGGEFYGFKPDEERHDREDLTLCADLADRIGGWVRMASKEETGEEFGVEVFVPAAEWAELYAREVAKQSAAYRELVARAPRLHLFCPACGQRHVDSGADLERLHTDHDCAHCKHRWAVSEPRPPKGWRLDRSIACFGLPAPAALSSQLAD